MKHSQRGSASLTAVILASFLLSLGGTGSAIALFRQNPDQFFAELRTYAQKLSNVTLAELPSITSTIGITPTTSPEDSEVTPTPEAQETPTETTPTPTITSTPMPTPTPEHDDDDDKYEKEEKRENKHDSRKRGLGVFVRGEQKLRQFLKFQFQVEAHDR